MQSSLGKLLQQWQEFSGYVSCGEFWGFCSIVAVDSVKQGYDTASVGNQTPTLESDYLYVHAVCEYIMYVCMYVNMLHATQIFKTLC